MSLEATLERVLAEVPGCQAAACVDVDSATVLALRQQAELPPAVASLLGPVANDVFESVYANLLAQAFDGACFDEVVMHSTRASLLLLRQADNPGQVLLLVCDRQVDAQQTLNLARASLAELAEAA